MHRLRKVGQPLDEVPLQGVGEEFQPSFINADGFTLDPTFPEDGATVL